VSDGRARPSRLGFHSYIADASDQVVSDFLSIFHGHDFDGIGLVVRAEDKMAAGEFDVLDGAVSLFADGIHVGFVLAVRLERVVVAVDKDAGPR